MTHLNVVPLITAPEYIKAEIVNMLCQAVEDAQAGKLSGLLLISVSPDARWDGVWAGSFRTADLVLQMAVVQHQLVTEYIGTGSPANA